MAVNTVSLWLDDRRKSCGMHVRRVEWHNMSAWQFDDLGILRHPSGGFFALASVRQQDASDKTQPIILQPEIGILGFACRQNAERIELLLQAKSEPGNRDFTQIGPTVQATVSNYQQRHGGSATPLLKHFEHALNPLTEVVQSEQGTRFFNKFNRNILVEVADNLEAPDLRYRWFGSRDVFALVECDFLLNTDARSVLASCDWASLVADTPFFESARSDRFGRALLDSYRSNRPCDEVFRQLERCRVTAKPIATVVGLYQASRWVQTPQGFIDQDRQCFDVILIDVDALDREVSHWQQPLLTNCGDSTVVLYCQMRANELQFLLRISNEIGFKESCQWGPSVNSQVDAKSHPLLDPVIWQRGQVRAEVRQSDEGGRFFQSVVHYALIEMPSDIELPSDEQNCWVTLGQIKEILNRSSYTNNELRSVLSLVLRWL